jgi:maleate isomerase
MARVSEESIIEAAILADHPSSEALFISCTGLPAVNVIDEIEQRLGKPVVTSNQATAWMMLQHANIKHIPQNFGQLFSYTAATLD